MPESLPKASNANSLAGPPASALLGGGWNELQPTDRLRGALQPTTEWPRRGGALTTRLQGILNLNRRVDRAPETLSRPS